MNGLLKHLFTGLLLLCIGQLLAQPTFTISPSNNLVDQGNTFTVDVQVSNFNNVASIQLPITWNEAIISYQSVSNINAAALPGLAISSFGLPGTGSAPDDRVILSWNHPSFAGVALPDQTVIFSITFQGELGGTTPLEFNPNLPQSIEVLDPDGNDLGFVGNDAMVTVNGNSMPTGFTLSLPDINASEGDNVCMPITVNDFDNILGMQFSMNYDPSALTYTGVQNFNAALLGWGTASVGQPAPAGPLPPGSLTATWNDPLAGGVTLADGATLFEICFDVTTTTSTTVTFSSTPTPVEIINTDEVEVPFNSESGTVTVGGGGGGGPIEGFALILPDVNADEGDNVCLPITVNDFENILGMQFSVNYDPSALTYTGVQNFNMALLGWTAGSVGQPAPEGPLAPGNLTFTWNDPLAAGVTLADGATLVEICFDVVTTTSTTVTFSSSPTPTEIINTDEVEVPFQGESGTVTVGGGGGGGPIEGFALILPDVNADEGDNVCLPVTVNDFENILGMQFSVNYDPSALTYTGVQNFNTALLGWTVGSVGQPAPEGPLAPGNLTFTWNDPLAAGVTLADGATLVEICFDVVTTTSTTVTFSGSPTPTEIINTDEMEVPFQGESGTITVGGGGGGPIEGFTLILGDVNANQGDNVCLPVTVNDFENILGMQFSINYDASALTYTGVQNFNAALLGWGVASIGQPMPEGPLPPGSVTATWNDPLAGGVTLTDGDVLFEICFDVNTSSTTTVTFSGSPTPIEIINTDEMEVPFNSDPGVITIGGGTPAVTLTLGDVLTTQGSNVCLPLTVTNFTDITSMSFTVNYDASILGFTGAQSFSGSVAGWSAGNITNPSAGTLSITWANGAGVTVGDGTVLVELCFDVNGATTSDVTIASPSLTNTDGPVSTNTNSGTVSIDNPIEGFTLILGDVTAMTGDNVCLPVTVNDFENILGMQFSINYDPAALTYTGVQNFNAALLGWGEASIGQPMPIGPLPPGSVTATWNDPLSGGVTLADGEVLFEICFDVTTTTTTTVTFSGMPTPIEVINTDEEEVPFNSNPGVVTIGTGGPDPVTLTLADVNTMQGSNVCLPLTVTNFTDINSMSFTVNYNSSILGFTGSQNFNASLPGWGAANITNPSPGTLTVTWSNASGITLPNGTSIVELCFDVNGMTTSDVTITNASLTNTDGAVTTNTNSGTVTVENPIEGFTLILGDATVMTGDNVCLPVTVNDFENILGMQFSINYDPAALTYTGVQNFNPALLGWGAASIGQPMPIGPLPPGSVTATWNDPLSGGVTLPDGDVLFEICFDVTTTTSTTVTFTGMPTPIEIINTDEEEVPFNSNPGVVTVGTVGPDPVSLTLADVVVMQGNNVCLPLTVTNFTDITSMSFTVNYDSSILGYTGAQNFSATLPGWGAANITNPSPGTLTVTWSNATGISLADGSVLVELCFDANGTTTSDVSISSPNLTDTNGAVTTNTEPGTVTIQTPFDGFTLIMGDATVMTGDNVCLPVTVNDFDNILGMQFSINYDPAALTYTGVQNFNPALLGWGASSIGQPMPIGPLPPGSVTATWNDPLSGGVTLADGDVLFEICFDVTTTTTTTVTFTDMPTPIEIINTAEEEVPFNSDPGIITIGTTEPGEFAVTIPTVEACNGEAVCLDLTAITFTNIQGMQFSITFNTADLSFTQVDNLNASLPGLTVASFNTSSAGTGTIIFQWDSTSGSGVDLPANAILFSLCFNKVSDNATTVTIGSTPTPIEIVDENETVIPFSGVTGQITCSPVPPLEFGQIDIVNLICADDPIGSVTIVNMVNGSGNYTYSWSVNGETGPSISGQGPGNVSVTVTDEDTGMTVDTTVTITSPPALTGSVLDIVNILCAGDNTGSITISAGGGVGPLSYDWSGDLTDNVTMQSGLPAGSYSVTIIDQNMCTLALENIQINELAPPITLSGNVTLIPGNGNPGGIDLDPQGGNGGYTYRWTGPNGYAFTGEDPNNITEVGEYCVTVEDSFGCTESICFDVWEVLRLQFFEITAACAGETNGGIDVTIAGGNCPGMNTYIWTSPPGGPVIANTEDLPDVGTGTYRLEVTDCSGASISLDFSINENDPIVITGTTMPVEVINDGSITLDDVTGGSDMGYTYAWEGPDSFTADTRDITGLANGEYTVTVTDSEGCTGTATFMVDAPALVLNQLITTEVPCWDDETGGSVFFRIGGGEPPVVLSIDGPSTQGGLLFDAMGERTVSPLPPGDYTYTITDSGSGMLTGEFTIEVPEPITAGTVTIVNDTEDPGGSGSVSISPSGGTGSLDVTWLGFSPGVQVIGVVGPVTVSGRITDSRGCELDIDYEVLQLTEEVEITNTGCDDTSDGEITVIAAGATEPYTYEWTREGETDPFSTEATVTGLAPGSYTVIIRDATGATLVRTYDVETESNYTVEASVIEQPSCFDSTNGAILAEVVNDGNSTSFTYEFVLNGSVIGTNMTGLLENLGAGEYTINVTDEFSCTASTTIGISAPAPVELPDQANAVKPISCGDRQDAEINAFASGGTAPYTYSWSVPGASGPQLTGLGAGTYSVTATDSEGCSATATYTVGEAMPLIVTIDSTPHTNADECDGTVTAVVLGGTPPYTYDWLNIPDNPNQSMVEGLCTGTYMLQVTDANGCTSSVVMVDVADERFECFEERVVITPDGNGSNDEFIIFCAEALTDNHLEIYNRWGQLVFMTDNYDNTWEGTSQNGDELPAGPYYWVLDYFSTTGEPLQRRGSLTIVRDN